MNAQSKKQGFTIIEVVLVLAIAALIFLMVFIALPALQASQRDTARKNDASIVSSAVTKYTSGERKAFTAGDISKLQSYIDSLDQYETTDVVALDAGASPNAGKIGVTAQAKCDGSKSGAATNSRQAAVVILLDNGKNTYCVDAS